MGERAELGQVSRCTQDIPPGLEPSWLKPGANQTLYHV